MFSFPEMLENMSPEISVLPHPMWFVCVRVLAYALQSRYSAYHKGAELDGANRFGFPLSEMVAQFFHMTEYSVKASL